MFCCKSHCCQCVCCILNACREKTDSRSVISSSEEFHSFQSKLNRGLASQIKAFNCCHYVFTILWVAYLCLCKDAAILSFSFLLLNGIDTDEKFIFMFMIYAIFGFFSVNIWLCYDAYLIKHNVFAEGINVYERVKWYQSTPMLGIFALFDFWCCDRSEPPVNETGNPAQRAESLKRLTQYRRVVQSSKLATMLYINNAYLIVVTLPQVFILVHKFLHESFGSVAFNVYIQFAVIQATLSLVSSSMACLCRGCKEESQNVLREAVELTLKVDQQHRLRQNLFAYYQTMFKKLDEIYRPLSQVMKKMTRSLKRRHPSRFRGGLFSLCSEPQELTIDQFGCEFIRCIAVDEVKILEQLTVWCKMYCLIYDQTRQNCKPKIWKEFRIRDAILERKLNQIDSEKIRVWAQKHKLRVYKDYIELDNWFDVARIRRCWASDLEEPLLSPADDDGFGDLVQTAVSVYTFYLFLVAIREQLKRLRKETSRLNFQNDTMKLRENYNKLRDESMRTYFPSEEFFILWQK